MPRLNATLPRQTIPIRRQEPGRRGVPEAAERGRLPRSPAQPDPDGGPDAIRAVRHVSMVPNRGRAGGVIAPASGSV